MSSYPGNWSLIEEYSGNYIFENYNKSFSINIDYIPSCEYPYSISFVQMTGQDVLIGIEDGAYVTHAKLINEAETQL